MESESINLHQAYAESSFSLDDGEGAALIQQNLEASTRWAERVESDGLIADELVDEKARKVSAGTAWDAWVAGQQDALNAQQKMQADGPASKGLGTTSESEMGG